MTPTQTAAQGNGRLIELRPPVLQNLEPLPQETPEEAAYRAAVDAAVAVIEAYDDGTAEHSDDVVTVSEAIADRLNVTGEERRHLAAVAQLHDIGKVTVPPEIINKPGPLDEHEWRVMRRHTIEGEQILSAVPEIAPVARIVRSCHERYDGKGYPDGLAGVEIPLVARIVFCADAFHAIRCDRPYRPGRSAADALAEIRANAGTQFDPVVVAALGEVHRDLALQRRRGGMSLAGATARSRRLVALLAVLTVSGSAMAATGVYKNVPGVGPKAGTERPQDAPRQSGAASAGFLGTAVDASKAAPGRKTRTGRPASPGSRRAAGTRPDPRGVAHGVRGTSPGQVAAKPKAKTPAAANVVKAPKVKAPKAPKAPKIPKVKTPPPTAGPKVKVKPPKAQVPVKAPKLPKAPKAQPPGHSKPDKLAKPAKP